MNELARIHEKALTLELLIKKNPANPDAGRVIRERVQPMTENAYGQKKLFGFGP